MKKALVLLFVSILALSSIQQACSPEWIPMLMDDNTPLPNTQTSTASVSGSGNTQTATMFFDRKITSQHLNIFNTYGDTATHSAELSLSAYQIAGWRLFNVKIDTESISAAEEKEVVGKTYENLNFQVADILGTFHSQIAQGFYNYSHNGVLVNYSIYYVTDRYSPALRGNASLVVRSGNQIDTAADITTPENMTASEGVLSWVTVSGENALLSANTIHWVVVDGSLLHAGGSPYVYPTIFWTAEDAAGTYPSKYRGTATWITQTLEALMNFTYIPWNQTANAPLTYSSPQQVNLMCNSSAITSPSFRFSSTTKNITSISFDTNQSIYFNYNMTLSYVKDVNTSVSWEVTSSKNLVDWGVLVGTSYPSVTGQISKYLNISKANSWTITGLYESATPTTNHTDYTLSGSTVRCASMMDGTWRLSANSFNHLSDVHTYDSSDDTELTSFSSILTDVDVNLTILEQNSDPVATGFANLTIVRGASVVWSPTNKSVSDGTANYLWNIDSTTSENGAFILEASWANGTDAGFLVKELVVFYPTSLSASESNIDAFTESTFEVRVYFQDTFTPQGLFGAVADALYSFDGGSNVSMTDHSNGTWTATISTIGKNPGTYLVDIYAEGYALQNRSVQISVTLIHDTETLILSWSNTNDITYIETTELSVYYNRITGSTPIPGAAVNVTINAKTYSLIWDGVSAYKITFNGTDIQPGFGVHGLTIEAWKSGYKAQSDISQILTIQEETTSMTYTWSSGNSITYIESTTLKVNYTMSNGSAILGAMVNATIGSDTFTLLWNGGTETYDYVFEGDASLPGMGIHSLTLEADKYGYEHKNLISVPFTIAEEPTTLILSWSDGNSITYVEQTTLSASYTMSNGSAIRNAIVNVTIGGTTQQLNWHEGSQTYRYTFFGTDDPPGFGTHSLMVEADLFGFASRSNSIEELVISEESTNLVLTWFPDFNITYIEETYLIANYTMSNGSVVLGATLNVTINSIVFVLNWHTPTQTYRLLIRGSDNPPGLGVFPITVRADLYGYVSKTDNTKTLVLQEDPTMLTISWSDGNNITFVEQTTLSAYYTMSNGSAVRGASVNVTIGTDVWDLIWHEGSQTYRVTFLGTNNPPGFGTHSLTVETDLFGFVSRTNSTEQLTITEEPTTMTINWSNGFSITYVTETTLSVAYKMSNMTPISSATVTARIGVDVWVLNWNPISESYEFTFKGNHDPPGIGVHPLNVEASRMGFVSQSDGTKNLVIDLEPTSLQFEWWLSDTITYVDRTALYVSYLMSNGSAVIGAYVNVTISSVEYVLDWNPISETYLLIISGYDPAIGLGIHSLVVQATLFGYEQQIDYTQILTINEETTTITISWISSNDITFLENTVLSVRYDMSNDSAIQGAWVNVTIGSDIWTLSWNPVTEAYEIAFSGSDDPPGMGIHDITVQADMFGFQSQSDSTNQLIMSEEPTNLIITWSAGNNITYIESTKLMANYTMSNGEPVLDAIVNVTIGSDTWTLIWNGGTETYEHVFYGNTALPGFGVHAVTVEADKFGYEYRVNVTYTFTIIEEPTTITPSWNPGNNITYIESTKLSVRYDMSNGTAISGAVVNITIGIDVWTLIWNPISEAYEITILGSNNPPGYGIHIVEIRASKYGYESILDSTQKLTIRLVETKISFEWEPSSTITYVGETKVRIFYQMSDGTPIESAIVNVTSGPTRWDAVWNSTSQAYEITWLGTSDPPGIGIHLLIIKAWKANYIGITDGSQILTISEEPTLIHVSWSNGTNITYVQSTTLLVNYTTTSGIVISAALVNVSIGSYNWTLVWNATSQLYEKTFRGSDSPPGLGIHSLSISGRLFGYEMAVDSSQTLIMRIEPTSLTPSWFPTNSITYVESTMLSVRYDMSNGTAIPGAVVNITIGTDIWTLIWNPASESYETIFRGTTSPPSFGTHLVTIQASKWGFQSMINSLESLTIVEEPTSFIISWSDGNNITYVKGTTLSVRYQMSNTSSIVGAVVNATINGNIWTLIWNPINEAYERYFAGSEDPPGYGTHIIEIRASKYGYVAILDSTQKLTIRLEDTSISFAWDSSNTITYVERTKIAIFYRMSNGTPIQGATVNVTINLDIWIATWNSTIEAYEVSFLGTNDPPGLGLHLLIIKTWKTNYVGITDTSQTLALNEEPTYIQTSWSNGNSITFVESTKLLVNYTTSKGTVIPFAQFNVTISTHLWPLFWNSTSQLYEITFSNASAAWPGLGTHGLTIRGWLFGYEKIVDSSEILTIKSEQVDISSKLLGGSTITFVGLTILSVNYTTSDGTPISGATVNVTISGTVWNLTWDVVSETYRIQFNGSDSPPGFGIHNLIINVSAYGFDALTDSSLFLTIIKEPTTLTAYWSAPNYNNVTYFDYTMLFVNYHMNNGSDILGANVNVTIDSTTWTLSWNSTEGAYSCRFDGDASPPGFGTHNLIIKATHYGYSDASNLAHSLTLEKDPTTIEVTWIDGNDITYIEFSILSVVYRMSNGTVILGAIVNATIGSDLWILAWNSTAGAYQVRFDGNQIPPGLGTFAVYIQASATVFVPQSYPTAITLRTESTTATPSWSSVSFDWTESVILSFDFRDSYGTLIEDATTKLVNVNGTEYTLQGTNGTYWIEFDNSYDLGFHNVWTNLSKFGYDSAITLSINFTIFEAQTDLTIDLSTTLIDYLGQVDLTVDYFYVGTGASVPSGGVTANITIDNSITFELTLLGNLWIANLTGVFLDLGGHRIDIRAQVYGYEYSESLGIILTVNEVTTEALAVTWTPSNLTIQYTENLSLSVEYTYYGGNVPSFATVNVSIEGLYYNLTYSAGSWSVSIPGADLGIGVRSATVSAWLYGYQLQMGITVGINVTLAANSFEPTWEPLNLQATYIDMINLSVAYTENFEPIIGATVELSINGTIYTLAYSPADKLWHYSMQASAIGLGVWNVTVTANKTGYANGWDSRLLTISLAQTNLTITSSSTVIYFDENITFYIYYQFMNTSIVPGANCTASVDSNLQLISWDKDHWVLSLNGTTLGLGNHIVVIHADAFGYESATDSFSVTVNAIPTSVSVDSAIYSVYPFDSVTVSFTWTDDKNVVGIADYVPDIIWPDGFSVLDHGNGTYSIELDNIAMHVGIYHLNVTFTRVGYNDGFSMVTVEIVELPIILLFDDDIGQFENETITVSIQMYDSRHSTLVNWSQIIIELMGVDYPLVYDNDSQAYSVDIWLNDLEPGLYTLNFTARATDCETEYGEIQLDIWYKIRYTLVLDVDVEAIAGQTIHMFVLATYESGTVSGFPAIFHILIERDQSETQERVELVITDGEGIAELDFFVPHDATRLIIWVDFQAAIGEWPAISNTIIREVTPSSMDILSFIISLFVNPVTLAIIIGGSGGSLAGLVFLRRRRGRRRISTSAVAEPVIAPSSEPSAPAGEMDTLQEKIRENTDGLTRTQIAQSLEISVSKAGAMVKKLLDSNPAFEEVREGRLRRIRFRGD